MKNSGRVGDAGTHTPWRAYLVGENPMDLRVPPAIPPGINKQSRLAMKPRHIVFLIVVCVTGFIGAMLVFNYIYVIPL